MSGPLSDLFGNDLPFAFKDIVERFTTDGIQSVPFAGGTLHSGTLQSIGTAPIELGFGELELPGATATIPFRLAEWDTPEGRWQLDIVLDTLSLKLRGLHGADYVAETATTPRHLLRRAGDNAVVITGEATIRFSKASADDGVVMLLVDNNAPTDPNAETGAVVQLRCNPRHFLIGSSQFGVTLTQLLFDASPTYSPPFVTGQEQGPEWVGFAIAEATIYAPPNAIGRGGFSGGVRNLLIGSPLGVQGELEIQWGRAPLDPATFLFSRTSPPSTPVGADAQHVVQLAAGQDEAVEIAAALALGNAPGTAADDWQVIWEWPDGSRETGDTSTGTVRHGQVLRATPEETSVSPPVRHPEIAFRFVASGQLPRIDVTLAGTAVPGLVHLSGAAADLAALQLQAVSSATPPGAFSWQLDTDALPAGASASLPATLPTGDHDLVLTEQTGSGTRVARLRISVRDAGPLLAGTINGVVDAAAPAAALTPQSIEGTYDLTAFHAEGRLNGILEDAELAPTDPAKVEVPTGAVAMVVIADSANPPPDPATTVTHDRHVQILFPFDEAAPAAWGTVHHPSVGYAGGSEENIHRELLQWAANYPGATFLAVGRCDDIGTDDYNDRLANARRATGVRLLTTIPTAAPLTAVAPGDVTSWRERDGQAGDTTGSPLTPTEQAPQRLIKAEHDTIGWPTGRDQAHEDLRATYRRVEIYAVGGTPAAQAVSTPVAANRAPTLRRILVPGADGTVIPAPALTPAMDYRVKLLIGWDKPTGEGWQDLIPSKAEFEFAWSPNEDGALPPLEGQQVVDEVLTVYGSWAHDDATGFTRTQLGIKSDGDPDGLIRFDHPALVTTLALGPVLLSKVSSGAGTVENAARISALAGAVIASNLDLGGGPLVGDGSKAVIQSIEGVAQTGDLEDPANAYQLSIVSDYLAVLHVNTGVLGLRTEPDHPVRFRYKDVTLRFDNNADDFWDKLGISYPTDGMQIEDPGKWKLDGALGQLLRAVETALGMGSIWFETRFAFALTIGVVEISEAVIRVTFDDGEVLPSLRGLVAKIDIPATVTGEGRLRIEEPGGIIKAGIDLTVIPLQLQASAAFAMAHIAEPNEPPFTFVSLYVKVQFPVGIPLGPSGAAIYGFIGQTAINGTRRIIDSDDIVKREIGWWMELPENKYQPRKDQHALGLGAVIGTLPDASFSMSAQGMIVVAFPDPEVIFGVEVKLLSVPDKGAKDQGGDQNATIIGLVVIDDEAVSLAVAANYEIPRILKLKVPLAARFPYSGHGIYVRIGSDGQEGRAGEPVTLTLLPDTLNLKAFSYLMIEQDGLPKLGGRADFSFEGFSIGFGAGAGLEWKAGPIRLSASILLLAGFGTDPLLIKAGIFVKGELDLVVISVSARGEITLTYQDYKLRLDGEFCGSVDCWFFSIEGCVDFHIGSSPSISVDPPPPPVSSVMLLDRGGRTMGEAAPGGQAVAARPIFDMQDVGGTVRNVGAAPRDNHTVWPDTVPQINFSHYVIDALSGGQFDPLGNYGGEPWFGGNRLKYAYRLDTVRLVNAATGVPVSGSHPLLSAWQLPSFRPAHSGGTPPPSGAEVRSLRLLDWNLWGWGVPMADGGASAPGNPADTIGTLCDPLPAPARSCLYGRHARGYGVNRIRLLREVPPPGPYPSFFTLTGRPGRRNGTQVIEGPALASLIATFGGVMVPGAVTTLPQPVAGPEGPLTQGYRLPQAQVTAGGRVTRTALRWLAEFDRTVRHGRLLLMVCDGTSRPADSEPRDCTSFDGLAIGRRHTSLAVGDYQLQSIDEQRPFLVTDQVDASQGSIATSGSDSHPDIRFAAPGLVIRPTRAVRVLELHLFRREPLPIEASWQDSAGATYSHVVPEGELGGTVLRVEAAAEIKEIVLQTRAKAVYLYRICAVGAAEGQRCFDFANVAEETVRPGRFTHADVRFTSLHPNGDGLRLADWVDARTRPASRGRDGTPELAFPPQGVELTPARPWTSVSIGVLSGSGPITAFAYDAGNVLVAQASDEAREPVDLHLDAARIARVVVSGGGNEGVIWRICHRSDTGDAIATCATLRGQKPQRTEKLEVEGLTFTPAEPGELIRLVDAVIDTTPIQHGQDSIPELLVPRGGLVITPAAPLAQLQLYVVTLGGERVEATATDASGAVIATDAGGGTVDEVVRLVLNGAGITRVVLVAGGKSLLTRFCTVPARRGRGDRLPQVVTLVEGKPQDWTPSLIGTIPSGNGGSCQLVAYAQPASVPDAAGFDIVPTQPATITLLSVCGIDSKAAQAQEQDQAAQDALRDAIGNGAGAPDPADPDPIESREVLLDPGETYRLEIDWSWRSWTSNDAATDSPPDVNSAPTPQAPAWKTGDSQHFNFAIAHEDLHGLTQDGLNEYRFDPRDIARYLARTEPADGRDVVFTDDPLWAHFSAGHVQALIDRYGRELSFEVRRTDPPPQPDADALLVAIWPLRTGTILGKGLAANWTAHEVLVHQAVLDAPCLPDGPVTGGGSIGATFALERHAMYDFNLLAVKKGAASPAQADPVVVSATRFLTSRYADPAEMIEALGFGIGVANRTPFAPLDVILPAGAPLPAQAAAPVVSDLTFGTMLAGIGLDTLPLPGETPRVLALWRDMGGGVFHIAGFLVDAPEALRREGAVLIGDTVVEVVRCTPDHLYTGGASFTPVAATLNWTRALFVPPAPVASAAEAELQFHFKVNGFGVTGRRTVNARPAMLDTEGF